MWSQPNIELLWIAETEKSKESERQKELELADFGTWTTKELEDNSHRDYELLAEFESAETSCRMLEERAKYVVSIQDWIKKGAEVKEENSTKMEHDVEMEIVKTVQQLEEEMERSRRLQKSGCLKEEWMTRRKELLAAKKMKSYLCQEECLGQKAI
jgi:putative cell wall-binding protein